MSGADIHFYFDPVCPFAWMTSKWVRMVAAQRDYTVDWRFISLRLINSACRLRQPLPGRLRGRAHLGTAAAAGRRAGQGRARAVRRRPVLRGRQQRDLRRSRCRRADPRHQGQPRLRRAAARRGGPARRPGGRPRRHAVGRGDTRRGRRGTVADRPGRRHADHPFQPAGRHGVLRPGDQQAARSRRRRPALGPCHGPGRLPWLRRAQAEPARAAAAAQLRRGPRHGRNGGRLARRQPQDSTVAPAGHRPPRQSPASVREIKDISPNGCVVPCRGADRLSRFLNS